MKSDALIERFRSAVHDTAEPPLWTDDECAQYADEAQKWFCRLTGGIADSQTDEICVVDMVAAAPYSAIDPRVLKIRHMRRGSDNREIEVLNFEDIQLRPAFTARYSNSPYFLELDDTQTGPVSAAVTGMEKDSVRWVYVPEEDDTAKLIVYRLPLETITFDHPVDLEIDDKHQFILIDGMKALAYAKEDAEAFDKGKQATAEQKFTAYCVSAKQDRERREHKYRTVRYGGI